jgi:two-component system chemotaxis response regulator CheV
VNHTITQSSTTQEVHRLELLLFTLGNNQLFGINVLKVRELMPCPSVSELPGAHSSVVGVAHLRGKTIAIIDLAQAIGYRQSDKDKGQSLIVAEVNRSVYGFGVSGIERIAVLDWRNVKPPSPGLGADCYITGVAQIDDRMIQVLDIERVLSETGLVEAHLDFDLESTPIDVKKPILVVDDSPMARNHTKKTLDRLALQSILAVDGKEALTLMLDRVKDGSPIEQHFALMICDIEMPEMDGYTLTREVRGHPQLKNLYILLHSSINSVMNDVLARKLGANVVLTKFVPAELAREVVKGIVSQSKP